MDSDDDAQALIWAKTAAGRAEMQTRALVRERAQRNLLLVIDGTKSGGMLLTGLAGISTKDFAALEALGLIEPVGGRPAATPPAAAAAPALPPAPALATTAATTTATTTPAAPAAAAPLDYAQFTATLTRLISKELGLRGFMLTLAVEKAATIEDLRSVARRALEQIRDRRGEAAAADATRALYGE